MFPNYLGEGKGCEKKKRSSTKKALLLTLGRVPVVVVLPTYLCFPSQGWNDVVFSSEIDREESASSFPSSSLSRHRN